MSLLKLDHIGKSYYGNQVLEGVNLEIKPGEVHGLIGENGAGKSTLMNILYGMPVIKDTGGYDGTMEVSGEVYNPSDPMDAMNAGIGMVHQEFMLIPGFTITENVKLNRENTKENPLSKVFGKKLESLDRDGMEEDTKEVFNKLNISLDYNRKASDLSVGYMQFAEIAKQIDNSKLKLLVLDEPTAVLTESEADDLLEIIKRLSDLGVAILFITHRLDEIMEVTDRITVLRDGKHVATLNTKDVSVREIAELMVGREIAAQETVFRVLDEDIPPAIKLENFKVHMPGELVRGLDLELKQGEILGLGGLAGQGKIGVANGIMGLYPAEGKMEIFGEEVKLGSPEEMLDRGVAFLSEDRKGVGLLLDESIALNTAYTAIEANDSFIKKLGPIKMVDKEAARKNAEDMRKLLDIRCVSVNQDTRSLSGGNQQKVAIARALTFNPKILLISEPTRGIDIGAKELVIQTLLRLNREEGLTILITSSELGELKQLADRIAIVTEGKVSNILRPDAPDADFGLAMAGGLEEVEA